MNNHLIIGSGHAARFVIKLLREVLPLVSISVVSRNKNQATRKLADLQEINILSDEDEIPLADMLWLAVPDECISDAFQKYKMQATKGICHLSGATSIKEITDTDASPIVIWPVASLSLPYTLSKISLVIECSDDHFFLHTLQDQRLHIFKTNYENRVKMHMLAVAANNFVHHLHTLIEEELKSQNLSKDFLMPLIEQTYYNILHDNLKNLQTGPARRADVATIRQHENIIKTPALKNLYQSITNSILHFYAIEL